MLSGLALMFALGTGIHTQLDVMLPNGVTLCSSGILYIPDQLRVEIAECHVFLNGFEPQTTGA